MGVGDRFCAPPFQSSSHLLRTRDQDCNNDCFGVYNYPARATIAQLVERPPCKRMVVGSIPTGGSIPIAAYSDDVHAGGLPAGTLIVSKVKENPLQGDDFFINYLLF